MQKLYFMIFSN